MPSPESKSQIPLKGLLPVMGKILQKTIMHRDVYSGIKWDSETNSVNVRRFKEDPEIK